MQSNTRQCASILLKHLYKLSVCVQGQNGLAGMAGEKGPKGETGPRVWSIADLYIVRA